jgi:hypothetical protein
MRVRKWLPLTLGMILPAIYLAVKWSRPEAPAVSHPPAQATSSAPEKSGSEPEPKRPVISVKTHGAGNDLRKVVYRLSKEGNPLTCDIFDEKGLRLLKCSFGYDVKPGPRYGKVVEAQIFDAQKKPLQRMIYTYDASGSPAKPITIDIEPTGLAKTLLGTALVGFNPLTDCSSASTQAAPR